MLNHDPSIPTNDTLTLVYSNVRPSSEAPLSSLLLLAWQLQPLLPWESCPPSTWWLVTHRQGYKHKYTHTQSHDGDHAVSEWAVWERVMTVSVTWVCRCETLQLNSSHWNKSICVSQRLHCSVYQRAEVPLQLWAVKVRLTHLFTSCLIRATLTHGFRLHLLVSLCHHHQVSTICSLCRIFLTSYRRSWVRWKTWSNRSALLSLPPRGSEVGRGTRGGWRTRRRAGRSWRRRKQSWNIHHMLGISVLLLFLSLLLFLVHELLHRLRVQQRVPSDHGSDPWYEFAPSFWYHACHIAAGGFCSSWRVRDEVVSWKCSLLPWDVDLLTGNWAQMVQKSPYLRT